MLPSSSPSASGVVVTIGFLFDYHDVRNEAVERTLSSQIGVVFTAGNLIARVSRPAIRPRAVNSACPSLILSLEAAKVACGPARACRDTFWPV